MTLRPAASDSLSRVAASGVAGDTIQALIKGLREAALGSARDALETFAAVAVDLCGADAAVIRLADADGNGFIARAVHARSPALAAELAGSHVPMEEAERPPALGFALSTPVKLGGNVVGSLEVLRERQAFSDVERALVELAAAQLALVLRADGHESAGGDVFAGRSLVLAGEALAAGSDDARSAEHVAHVAAEAAGARAALLWRADGDEPKLAASVGDSPAAESAAVSAARIALESRDFLIRERIGGAAVVSVRLGQPAAGVLQLVFDDDPDDGVVAGLTAFAVRAAQALRTGDLAQEAARELERSRALLAVIGQATAELSLDHVLATALDHVSLLAGTARVAVYLREGRRLHPADARNLAGPHGVLAEALLELALGAYRGRGMVAVADLQRVEGLATAADAAGEAGITAALALPLVVQGEAIGLLAAYPEAQPDVTAYDEVLLGALAAQLAAVVQNARLHEKAERRAAERQDALDAEREAARRVRALYEVSESFAQSLSLDATLEALARSAVELLGVAAAVIRMPDVRGDQLVCRAIHVPDQRLAEAMSPVLTLPQPLDKVPLRRMFRTRRPLVLTPERAQELGGSHRLLAPFLAKGASAAVVPIATPAEVMGTLTIVSFDPQRPIGRETLDTVLSITAQAALAIDNGRLYQQQKEFADTMRRSLLPRSHPELQGLEIGEVYQPSARVDVGGDVYDFLELGDGRLAVVLGDVTGHGIEAAADMAMAKFVFRSLAREHPEPGDFLASANDVVVDEIAPGKFITMIYLAVDSSTGSVVVACAGHPAPLLVAPDGTVEQLGVHGLALGVDPGQTYEEKSATLERGGALVVYTDGVIEARREGEFYGAERLIEVVGASLQHPAAEIARAAIDDCRAFAGDLADDCAIVVIKR
jgi:serine phosphatase RsbU (regulator of sigma subunit)